MTRYRINFRFVAVVGVVIAAVAAGTHFLHKQQSSRQAALLKEQADAAETRGEPARAAGYLRRYLAAVPDDHDVRARLGLILSRNARSPSELFQAYLVLEEALRGLPERTDIRRRVVEIALTLGTDLLPEAKRHLDALIRSDPKDGQLEVYYADAHLLEARFEEARHRLQEAIRKQPDLYAAHLHLAALLRERLNRPGDAAKVIEDLAAEYPKSAEAQLAAAAFWESSGDPDRRAAAVARARALAPTDLEVLLAVGEVAKGRARAASGRGDQAGAEAALAEARTALAAGIARYAAGVVKAPSGDGERERRDRVAGLFRELVAVEVRAGRFEEAEAVARKGLGSFPDDPALWLALADVHISRKRFDDAGHVLDRVQGSTPPIPVVAYYRGRIHAGRREWLPAIRVLEDVTRNARTPKGLAASASLLLGGCYEQIGELDRRYTLFSRAAAAADPGGPVWVEAQTRLAVALVEMGRTDDAIQVYKQLAAGGAAGANVPLGRLLLVGALRQPAEKRDWAGVERVIEAAPDGIDATILRAELATARGRADDARRILTEATAGSAGEVRPWLALVLLEQRAGQAARAKKLLETTREKFGDSADVRLAEARMLTEPDLVNGLGRLAAGAERFPAPDARRLLLGLAELADRGRATDLAAGFRERVCTLAPDDLGTHLARLDDAIRGDDDAAARATLARVREIDGETGTSAMAARAVYLIWRAQTGDGSGLPEAQELLAAAEKQRPWWSRVAFARGLIADLKGDLATAATRYREAIDAGDRRPELVRRLLELYYVRQQYRDAEDLLRRLPETTAIADGDVLVAELSTRSGNYTRAVEFAARGVPDDSRDPKKLLWLAQVRRLAGAPAAEVEAPVRRAIEVAGDQPDAWVSLVQFLSAAGRKPEAESEAANAERQIRGPGRSLALAQGQETLGHFDRARELFAAALGERPDDAAVLRAGAAFFLRANDPDRAKELCEHLLRLKDLSADDRLFAVRMVSLIVTTRQDYQTSRRQLEAIGVLKDGQPVRLSGSETIDQLRTRAVALGVQPDAALRREAIAALEAIELRKPLAADDQFLLARLYVSVGDWARARARLAPLVRPGADNLYYVAYYGASVLRHDGDVKEARRALELLEQHHPDATRTVALKARVLEAEGKPNEAADAVLGYVGGRPERFGFAAGLLERLGLGDRAEPLYRKPAADPTKPAAGLGLASYLGRMGRTADALALLRSLNGKLPAPALAMTAGEVLYHAPRVEPADVRAVEELIRAAGPKAKGFDPRSLTALVRMVEGRYPEAIALYREVAAGGSTDATAMNNLGYLLAVEAGQCEEGLEWVRKAQNVAGPLATLRDTEAVILLRMGKPEDAVELLTDITRESGDPTAFFHLGQAYKALNDRTAAANAFDRAKRLKIRPIDLPPSERRDLERGVAAR